MMMMYYDDDDDDDDDDDPWCSSSGSASTASTTHAYANLNLGRVLAWPEGRRRAAPAARERVHPRRAASRDSSGLRKRPGRSIGLGIFTHLSFLMNLPPNSIRDRQITIQTFEMSSNADKS